MLGRPCAIAAVLMVCVSCGWAEQSAAGKPQQILPMLEKCADAQLAEMGNKAPSDWTAATFYVGLARLTHVSTDPKYAKAAFRVAEANGWSVHSNTHGAPRRFFADDQAIGQLYIDLAASSHHLELLNPLISEETALLQQLAHFDPRLPNPNHFKRESTVKLEPIPWWWCDSLFMNPPVLARLSAVTGESKFIDGMDKAYWQTAAMLYDRHEHLFYRDNRFIGKRSKNGKKVFWSRGDGWVMAGLAEVLTYMPEHYPSRPKYVELFREMAGRLMTLQQKNGLWPMNLLDPEDGEVETSGSAFFTYAFAWGINHGLLERSKFEPAARKGWEALVSRRRPDGQLGFVQPVGLKPESGKITAEDTQYYGNGAFILAGTEMMKLNAAAPPAPSSH